MYFHIEHKGTRREIKILHAKPTDWEPAMGLAWRTFAKFEAAEYPKEGSESFINFISDSKLHRMFLLGVYRLWVAKAGEEIVGIISLREHNHISLLFVEEEYQHYGIGRALILTVMEYLSDHPREAYLPENEAEKMLDMLYTRDAGQFCTVNAAPYAVEFYHRMGFRDIGAQQMADGIIFVPMRLG